MDFLEHIQTLATKVQRQREHIQTEEATKNAFVMPFISVLGYDVFDPTEVVPEFTADVGIKKGEKVDYAIMQDGKPILLFECKQCSVDLGETHASQLYRYFSVTEARIAVLTNGIVYRFYTDLENSNQMDTKPFLEVDILDLQESLVNELKKLTKSAFNLDDLLTTASELKYTREIRILLEEQLTSPSEEFVRFFTGHVYTGLKTQAVLEQFAGIVKRAMYQFINDQINRRLKSVLGEEQLAESERPGIDEEDTKDLSRNSRIVTSEEELEGFYIVKSILRETVDLKRIAPRDTINYFGILLDDSNRKPLCRLHFNRAQKYLGLFDAQKNETRVPINDLNELYQYAGQLKATVEYYDQPERETGQGEVVRGGSANNYSHEKQKISSVCDREFLVSSGG